MLRKKWQLKALMITKIYKLLNTKLKIRIKPKLYGVFLSISICWWCWRQHFIMLWLRLNECVHVFHIMYPLRIIDQHFNIYEIFFIFVAKALSLQEQLPLTQPKSKHDQVCANIDIIYMCINFESKTMINSFDWIQAKGVQDVAVLYSLPNWFYRKVANGIDIASNAKTAQRHWTRLSLAMGPTMMYIVRFRYRLLFHQTKPNRLFERFLLISIPFFHSIGKTCYGKNWGPHGRFKSIRIYLKQFEWTNICLQVMVSHVDQASYKLMV